MRRALLALPILVLLLSTDGRAATSPPYAIARIPTPLFGSADLRRIFGGADGRTLRLDRCGQMRDLEFVAPPGTVFTVEEAVATAPFPVFRVTTAAYPYPTKRGYFIDGRCVEGSFSLPAEIPKRLPSREEVIASLLAAEGTRYLWGGNLRHGVPELLTLYPPGGVPDAETLARWQLQGVDCSGLLYEATGGWTPRNTSALVGFGTAVPIAGAGREEIITRLRPLDLIVWNGHVIIVIDRQRVIESRLVCGSNTGVTVTPLRERLTEVMRHRSPVDDYRDAVAAGKEGFVVRRWFEQSAPPSSGISNGGAVLPPQAPSSRRGRPPGTVPSPPEAPLRGGQPSVAGGRSPH
jgi:hypothetical protein